MLCEKFCSKIFFLKHNAIFLRNRLQLLKLNFKKTSDALSKETFIYTAHFSAFVFF
jgi:hypothetical protein